MFAKNIRSFGVFSPSWPKSAQFGVFSVFFSSNEENIPGKTPIFLMIFSAIKITVRKTVEIFRVIPWYFLTISAMEIHFRDTRYAGVSCKKWPMQEVKKDRGKLRNIAIRLFLGYFLQFF